MISLIAKQSFAYAGKRLRIGERFGASASDAKLLKAIGRAGDAPVEITSAPKLRTRAIEPEPVLPPEPIQPEPPMSTEVMDTEPSPVGDEAPTDLGDETPARSKRTYRRRDLTPEN